ncbi:type I DNA topoisomerase, partial [Patescibacteria group bacterium]|nr:type I DNA topoisomerase [Patescibacteria group bacterium]
MKNLILVESPTKAKTLFKFLKGGYDIEASMGHIRDLPKGNFGIDVENNFALKFVVPKDKRKIVEDLRSRAGKSSKVILATDPDREGEAIASHLHEILKDEVKKGTKFERIVFHEITQSAIEEAIKHPRDIDQNLVSAQTARRVLDRIVGYRLSPLLWKKIKRNLSGGRVQSVAVRLIVEREREIEKFKKEDYFKLSVILSKAKDLDSSPSVQNDNGFEFNLVKIDSEPVEVATKINLYDGEYRYTKTILDKEKAEQIEKDLQGKNFEVIDVTQKETKRSPYPPFITSTLQQEAARRFGFSGKKTMSVAQKLYEEGFITYHRTDSFNLSTQFITAARKFVEKEFGSKYLPESPRMFRAKSKLAQEAHEAIRPTSVENKEEAIRAEFGRDFAKLYGLIYRKAIASQMADAIFESTKVSVEARLDSARQAKNGKVYLFEKNGSVLKFDGFLKLGYYEDEENLLPDFKISEKLKLSEVKLIESQTNPPPRYNEAALIAALEKNGIGRPSTYAPIISTIQDRNYIEKEEGRFIPTIIGIAVNDFLVKNFADIDDIPFTVQMEDKLDEIAQGQEEWVPMIKEFYAPFEKKITDAEKEDRVKLPVEKTGKKCPECGNDIIVKIGRFGKFLACSSFPDCKYTAPLIEETKFTCPQDGGKIVVKKTRRGRKFYACSNYPKCKYAVWKLQDIGKPMPEENSKVKTQNSKIKVKKSKVK